MLCFANRGIFFLHSQFWLTRLPQNATRFLQIGHQEGKYLALNVHFQSHQKNISFILRLVLTTASIFMVDATQFNVQKV